MPSETDILRQEPIHSLGPRIAQSLSPQPPSSPPPPGVPQSSAAGNLRDEIRTQASATCIQCGIALTGEELLCLAEPSAPGSPKINRLRLGYCARSGCDSAYYQLRLPATTTLISTGAPPATATPNPLSPAPQPRTGSLTGLILTAVTDSIRRAGPRLAAGFALAAALLIYRHWHLGGTIPLVREPETFVVEVPPEPPHPFAHRMPGTNPQTRR